MEYKNFSVDNLTGDDTKTDGTKIYAQTSAPIGVATGTVWINI